MGENPLIPPTTARFDRVLVGRAAPTAPLIARYQARHTRPPRAGHKQRVRQQPHYRVGPLPRRALGLTGGLNDPPVATRPAQHPPGHPTAPRPPSPPRVSLGLHRVRPSIPYIN